MSWLRWFRELGGVERDVAKTARRLEGLEESAAIAGARMAPVGTNVRLASDAVAAHVRAARASLAAAEAALEQASRRAATLTGRVPRGAVPRPAGYAGGVKTAREFSTLQAIQRGEWVHKAEAAPLVKQGLIVDEGMGIHRLTRAGWIAIASAAAAAAAQAVK